MPFADGAAGSAAASAALTVPAGAPLYETSRSVCFGRDVWFFVRMDACLLLTMCKNRHAPRICKINSTNGAFFITNTRHAACRRAGFSSLRVSFRCREMACAPFFSRCGRCLIKEPPCNRREVGGEGRGAFGFVIGGLVYPLEIVYPEFVGIRTCQIVAQVAGSSIDMTMRVLRFGVRSLCPSFRNRLIGIAPDPAWCRCEYSS